MILYNDFDPFNKIEWVACDTETFTYIDGEKVSNDTLLELGKTKPAKFFREHATVRVWAWQISDGEHFFVSNDFDEFIAFFGEHKIKTTLIFETAKRIRVGFAVFAERVDRIRITINKIFGNVVTAYFADM